MKRQHICKIMTSLLLVCSMTLFSGCAMDDAENWLTDTIRQAFGGGDNDNEGTSCTVYFLDVGQGDSTLIITDSAAILIDAGEQSAGDDVLADLQQYGVETLDWIICTHPHADHIGGFSILLDYAADYSDLTIENAMMPDLPDSMIPTTQTYENFLDGIEKNDISITTAEKMTLDLGSASLQIIPSPGTDYSLLNDYSICAYLTCGETCFFFTGDASEPEETDLLEAGQVQSVDVLKVGHHGSKESSTETFLGAMQPSYAVISCGADNSYGHPTSEALERLEVYCGTQIWRTDEDGTVEITSDGETLTVTTEKG
ncbi:MAG: MBL fold metallo-hydrolase [Ruminococcus sp.]|nr:MBL fold metallo-hydrolase [Ruminococcus sp.]